MGDRDKIKQNIKDMTLEDLQIALEEQNMGLFNSLREIVLSQIDVIKEQQVEIKRNRDLIETLTNTVNRINAQTQIVIQKQKDLEEFALIASGVKKVNETKIGMDKLKEEAEKYIDTQEKLEKENNSNR